PPPKRLNARAAGYRRPSRPFVLAAVLAQPVGQLARAADRAQAAFGLGAGGGGDNDQQPVPGAQHRGGGGDQAAAVADDQRDAGLGGQPELEDLHPVQLGAVGYLRLEQVGMQVVEGRGVHDDLKRFGGGGDVEPSRR